MHIALNCRLFALAIFKLERCIDLPDAHAQHCTCSSLCFALKKLNLLSTDS
jgi:hypothetical protein